MPKCQTCLDERIADKHWVYAEHSATQSHPFKLNVSAEARTIHDRLKGSSLWKRADAEERTDLLLNLLLADQTSRDAMTRYMFNNGYTATYALDALDCEFYDIEDEEAKNDE